MCQSQTLIIVTPNHKHDCDSCTFVGHHGESDVYKCADSVIVRHSGDGPDYSSFPLNIARQIKSYDIPIMLIDNYQSATE